MYSSGEFWCLPHGYHVPFISWANRMKIGPSHSATSEAMSAM